jgi:hypothetical protein
LAWPRESVGEMRERIRWFVAFYERWGVGWTSTKYTYISYMCLLPLTVLCVRKLSSSKPHSGIHHEQLSSKNSAHFAYEADVICASCNSGHPHGKSVNHPCTSSIYIHSKLSSKPSSETAQDPRLLFFSYCNVFPFTQFPQNPRLPHVEFSPG